ncbi:calcium-binding protein [Tropicimonas isoalkanivorans]|uniref:Hemolysin-type calcium-binding repeat-containing protein n=1 Tax=Tropicimonas isoalkanivorans TaxID=441112 RepID=A0A1I1HHK9_9RHOB|nr:calcium-binding protein [Tropicimonas isoalkanivorans]SFC23454.1 Hemolysin-type calcium-binding repeat-containing protein [Tropicimonas isoalkanivorans]
MSDPLASLLRGIILDPGLQKSISDAKIAKGVRAAETLNAVLLDAIEESGVNKDGLLTARDMATISTTVYGDPAQYVKFLEAHGNDNGDVVSGFHHVQGDGGTLVFKGRNFIDTVADAIYHYGFKVKDGRYVNEDGAANETTKDVAGWLNYFLNGENVVFGGGRADQLGTGEYSKPFRDANNETYYAGGGDDKIWAGQGRDKIYGQAGDDTSGGGDGNDRMWGGAGADHFGGDAGRDRIWGGEGKDTLSGGDGADMLDGGEGADYLNGGAGDDTLYGGANADAMYGSDGADRMDGGAGADRMDGGAGGDRISGGKGDDELSGSDGFDRLFGNAGDDTLTAGAGRDRLIGGTGRDVFKLWESKQATDTLVFNPGDSTHRSDGIDLVEGFNVDNDKIDLSGFGDIVFKKIDFAGHGQASAYYDGTYLRIDENGDRAVDMMIEFTNVNDLSGDNFIL